MTKKLWRVSIVAYVVADGVNVVADVPLDSHRCSLEIEEAHEMPMEAEWFDEKPFGENEGLTCGEWIRGMP